MKHYILTKEEILQLVREEIKETFGQFHEDHYVIIGVVSQAIDRLESQPHSWVPEDKLPSIKIPNQIPKL